MKIIRFITITIVTALTISSLHAEIKWEQKQQSVKAKLGDKKAVVQYPFENRSKNIVKIDKVSTSCSCTAADPEKKIYQPGEKGFIEAVFDFKGKTGLQKSRIIVHTTTDNDKGKNYELKLAVDIPRLLEMEPSYLIWRKDDFSKEKIITARILVDQPVNLSVESTSTDYFSIEIETED